ncbi:ubiquitin carboxyl-terminal hydrolase [Chloropicon primus]|uniref:Ubiquitin carboxyl-terminal hydrolase n=1 Tax=Chloropicon primus TaxID=1764295 RepID=A0A5B8MQ58_9CHLO|nr:ubiquitin carboxyl-terminal hydrolase [Chloropicon primus]UPR01712.1 ubiquitin carboxyl-terminal hydrolase [Chloropicon primus]|eukprot:QDZ22491.1 ubiquitin carboxyl-terminal hydrolase [Chloropicon primus]
MTTKKRAREGSAEQKWKGALYQGKRASLRKIPFAPATRVESGKTSAPQVQKHTSKALENTSANGHRRPSSASSNVMHKNGGDVSALNDWSVMFRPGAGLHNLGNTCFMNSVLQCLTYTPPLAQSCLENQYNAFLADRRESNNTTSTKFDAMQVFQSHVNTVLRAPGKVVPPHKFSRSLKLLSGNRFRLGRQEDAHEYFTCLVESMEKSFTSRVSLGRGNKKPTQEQVEECFIYRVFGGKLRSQIHCTGCNYKSNKYDPILDLSLEIFRTRSLEKALNMFTSKEVLDGNNKYSCPQCKNMVRANKQMLISEAPNILAIQLKRFAFGKYGMKIENFISFPSRLDMTKYVSGKQEQPTVYSLYGVLVHSGHSLHSGHYYCYVKCPSGAWVCCDDNVVHQVSETKVMEQKAYMLFYSKVVQRGKGGEQRQIKTSLSPAGVDNHLRQEVSPTKNGKTGLKMATSSQANNGEAQPVGSPGKPRSPTRKSHFTNGSPMPSPRSSKSPRGWKKLIPFVPGSTRNRLNAVALVSSSRKRRRSLGSLGDEALPRRSERIIQRMSKTEPEKPEEDAAPGSKEKKAEEVKAEGSNGVVRSLKHAGAVALNWLKGDRGRGEYGVPVNKWEGEDINKTTAAQANALFRKLKPKQKRRDRYDEEYDMGKVKKVKVKNKMGRKRLGSQNSAFQRAAKGKFDRRNSRLH